MEPTVNPASDVKGFIGTAGGEIKNLIADVKDLVSRVAQVKDPNVALVRSRVLNTLGAAHAAMSAGAGRMRKRAANAAGTTNDFVRENPWQSLGIAVLLGAAVGYLATRRAAAGTGGRPR